MLALALTLLRLAFAGCVADLDAPAWATREAATKELRGWMPASLPAVLHAADATESPEVRQRCEALLEPLGPWNEARRYDAILAALIDADGDCDELPWLGFERYSRYADDLNMRWAMDRRVQALRRRGFFKGQTFYAERTPSPDTFQNANEHWLSGLNSIRFVERGLPEPLFGGATDAEMRERWAAVKKQREKK